MMLFTFSIAKAQSKLPVGIWKGIYFCSQGETGLTLEIHKYGNNSKTEFYGTFEFYPNSSTSNARYGKYSVKGKIVGNKIEIYPNEWIINPVNYKMVGLSGKLSENNQRFKGSITEPDCGIFNLHKL